MFTDGDEMMEEVFDKAEAVGCCDAGRNVHPVVPVSCIQPSLRGNDSQNQRGNTGRQEDYNIARNKCLEDVHEIVVEVLISANEFSKSLWQHC